MSGFSFAALQKVAKESGFTVIDAGTYTMEITKSEAVKSKDGSKDMIKVTMKVVVGPWAGKGSLINNFVISPDNGKALFFFFKHMAAFGLDDEYFAKNPPLPQVAKDLVGRRALVDISVGEFKGNQKNDVDGIKPLADGPQSAPAIGGGVGIPNIKVATPATSTSNGSGNGTPNVEVPQPAIVGASADATTTQMPDAPF
jgi:hypothetical protein